MGAKGSGATGVGATGLGAAGLSVAEPPDRPVLQRLLRLAYGLSEDAAARSIAGMPSGYRRVWREAPGEPASGTITLIPMGQCFGGRRVQCSGVHAVAVAPEDRSGGTALRLMTAALRQMAEEGAAISTLYASVQSLYRQVGYEHAGLHCELHLNLRMLPRRGPGVALRPMEDADQPALRDLHERFSAGVEGAASRDPFLWSRVHQWREQRFEGLLLDADAPHDPAPGKARSPSPRRAKRPPLAASIFVNNRLEEHLRQVDVSDLAFLSAPAGRSLLRALADFAPMLETALLRVGPAHPLVTLLDQQWHAMRIRDTWMLRILDLPAAIAQRGFCTCLDLSFRLLLEDDLFQQHAGEWVIEIAGGDGQARRPTRRDDQPLLTVSPRGLATVWSGFMGPRQAQRLELLDGPDAALDLAHAAFSGPMPTLLDRF